MLAKPNLHRRHQSKDRALMLLPLAITPSLGVHLLSHFTQEDGAAFTELKITLVSTIFHACLITIVPLRREGDGLRVVVLSALAFTLLTFAGPLLQNFLLTADYKNSESLVPIWTSLSWGLGAILVAFLQILSRGGPEFGDIAGSWIPKASYALTSVSMLTASFWLLSGIDLIMIGEIPSWKGIGNALILGILPVTSAAATRRTLGLIKRDSLRRSEFVIISAFVCSIMIIIALALLPDLTLLGRGSTLVLLALTCILALALTGQVLTDYAASTVLALSAIPLVAFTLSAELPARVLAALMLLAVVGALFIQVKERDSPSNRAIHLPNAGVMGALQDRLGTYIVHLNFDQRVVQFPLGGGVQFGADVDLSLTEFFRLAPMNGVIDLMQKLQRGEAPTGIKLQFRLRKRGPIDGRQEWIAQPFTVHVIENHYPQCWIALARESYESEQLAEQSERLTSLLSSTLRREDRFLMALGQDIRAPLLALSSAIDALTPDAPIADAKPTIRHCLEKITSTLDSLQFDADISHGALGSGTLSLREFSKRIEDQFLNRLSRSDSVLRISLPHQADLPLRADHGSVQVSLSRLFDNILKHSGATEVSLSAFVTSDEGGRVNVAWHLSDNGRGTTHDENLSALAPLAPSFRKPGTRVGLGLYAARQAMQALGGDLIVQKATKGTHVVLSYPAVIISEDQRRAPVEVRSQMALLRKSFDG